MYFFTVNRDNNTNPIIGSTTNFDRVCSNTSISFLICDSINFPNFIINIGDLMQRWTNNRWVSSLHRVVIPSNDLSKKTQRLSIAYFHQPDWNAEIRCIPSCINHNEKPFYLPIRSGVYLMRKFRSTTL